MNKKRLGDVRLLTASMPASMVEAIESACNARGMSRSAWIRDILTPILEREYALLKQKTVGDGEMGENHD